MADIVKLAYVEFIASGKRSIRDPECLFFELDTKKVATVIPLDGIARRVTEDDFEQVVRLQRLIHNIPTNAPVIEEERIHVRANQFTICFELDRKIVATVTSPGLVFQAFQILGVVTDPEFRRRGYAKAVCSYLLSSMRELGGTKAILFTGKDNTPAIKCYLELGFRITDRYYFACFE
jgi:ribosomal protein S18 acetylase RimI-like enzyme